MNEGKKPLPTYSAEVTLFFGDADHLFRLRIREIGLLQNRCSAGFGEIISRVNGGGFHILDVYETIRLGLEGGGMAPVEAAKLATAYIDGQPLAREGDPSSPLAVARVVLSAALFGMDELVEPGEELDKKKDETTMGESASPSSTDKEPASTGPQRKSRRSRSTSLTPP